MKHLVGRSFSIADGRYRIVDVQSLAGDALVYAERMETLSQPVACGSHAPARPRTAFHYGDIAGLLEAPGSA